MGLRNHYTNWFLGVRMVLSLCFLKRLSLSEIYSEIYKDEMVCKNVLQNNIAGRTGQ